MKWSSAKYGAKLVNTSNFQKEQCSNTGMPKLQQFDPIVYSLYKKKMLLN